MLLVDAIKTQEPHLKITVAPRGCATGEDRSESEDNDIAPPLSDKRRVFCVNL